MREPFWLFIQGLIKTTAPTHYGRNLLTQACDTEPVSEVHPATLRIRPLVKYRWSLTPARVISGTHYDAHQDQPAVATV